MTVNTEFAKAVQSYQAAPGLKPTLPNKCPYHSFDSLTELPSRLAALIGNCCSSFQVMKRSKATLSELAESTIYTQVGFLYCKEKRKMYVVMLS